MQHHLLRTRHAAPFPLALLVVWTAGTASFSLPPPKLPGQLAAMFGKPPLTESDQTRLLQFADTLLNTKDEVIKSKDEAIKSKDEAIKRADEAMKSKDEAIKEAMKSKDEAIKSKDDKPTLSPKP